MVPAEYYDFFVGCATVAGTLIGLLFVAISVSPHKNVGLRAPLAFQIQAGAAFTALTPALIVSLFALLPGQGLGIIAVITAGGGISPTIGMTVLSLRGHPGRRQLAGLIIIPAIGLLYVLQLLNGISLMRDPQDPGALQTQGVLVILFFLIAIARAWQLIGVHDTGLPSVIGDLVREHEQHRNLASAPATGHETAGDADSADGPRLMPRTGDDSAAIESDLTGDAGHHALTGAVLMSEDQNTPGRVRGPLAEVIATRGGQAPPEAPFVIEHREALIYILSQAAELEHGIMTQYLFAAFSLKQSAAEGLTEAEAAAVQRWRRQIMHIAAQEMLHLALVQNLLSALGAAPHLARPNFPLPAGHYPAGVYLALLPFGEQALRHFMFLERCSPTRPVVFGRAWSGRIRRQSHPAPGKHDQRMNSGVRLQQHHPARERMFCARRLAYSLRFSRHS